MRSILVVVLSVVLPVAASAQLRTTQYASGFSAPVAFVQDPTQAGVQFVVEQGGRIRVIQNGVVLAQDFLNLQGQVSFSGEQGLLGLAFAPDYATSRRFFVNFTNLAGHTVIARFQRSATNPLQADASTRFDFGWPGCQRYITQPFANHNGGSLEFGDDGFLYIGLGDGGSGGDPMNNAQSATSLLGKMLRIDVNVPASDTRGYAIPSDNPHPFAAQAVPAACGGSPAFQPPTVNDLVWDLGLRNPWRYSFDLMSHGGSGALIIADVGQGAWEEVDYEPRGAGARNYGWRNREGAHDYDTSLPPARLPLIDPITEYSHATGFAIAGGEVYRGTSLGYPYFGRYFFADYSTGRVWSVRLTRNPTTGEATASDLFEHTSELGGPAVLGDLSAFGIDARCEMYMLGYSAGTVLRITSTQATTGSGCATPDPFATVGGGILVNGQWLPQGHPGANGVPMTIGAASAPPPVTPPAPPTPPVTAPAPIACAGSAPVAGWVCVGTGWLPPNHPQAGAPVTPPAAPTTPVTPVVSTPAACAIAAPVTGWVCVNGGWVPPNHPLAASGGAPAPPLTTPAPPASSSCVGSDPFIAIPGMRGVCINGGWVPANNPIAGGI